jgi:hypothetical protein
VSFTGIEFLDFETFPIGPRRHWPLVDLDLKPMRIDLAIWKSRGLFPKRIIGPSRNADAATTLLRARKMGNQQNESGYDQFSLHDAFEEHFRED